MDQATTDDQAQTEGQAGGADAGGEPSLVAGPVILIVDDDPLLGGVIEACLDFEGADVRTAHTLEAARAALDGEIDFVVLDRRLPDGDGLDLLDDVTSRSPDADVVVFSAYDDDGSGPADLVRVPKTDVAGLVDLLGLERDGVPLAGVMADPNPPAGTA